MATSSGLKRPLLRCTGIALLSFEGYYYSFAKQRRLFARPLNRKHRRDLACIEITGRTALRSCRARTPLVIESSFVSFRFVSKTMRASVNSSPPTELTARITTSLAISFGNFDATKTRSLYRRLRIVSDKFLYCSILIRRYGE